MVLPLPFTKCPAMGTGPPPSFQCRSLCTPSQSSSAQTPLPSSLPAGSQPISSHHNRACPLCSCPVQCSCLLLIVCRLSTHPYKLRTLGFCYLVLFTHNLPYKSLFLTFHPAPPHLPHWSIPHLPFFYCGASPVTQPMNSWRLALT